MGNNKKYLGIIIFVVTSIVAAVLSWFFIINPILQDVNNTKAQVAQAEETLKSTQERANVIKNKLEQLKQSRVSSRKKIYSPTETFSDDKNDSLFFALYSDVMEMLHANSIKIKSIDYTYNPSGDKFVEQGSLYFVCDIDMELVSNYINLGKFIEDVYQYPYYIKINKVDVKPYPKDKKILLSKVSLRLYAHTEPLEDIEDETSDEGAIDGAETPIPAE